MFLMRPLPAYAPDAPIAELGLAELFVVCAVRLWVLHYRDPDQNPADWRDAFAHSNIDRDAESGFDGLFHLVAAAAVRTIDIRCQRCRHLGDDEAWLLQLLFLLQDDRPAEAAMILHQWIPAAVVNSAIRPAQVFAAGLAARGLRLPQRRAQPNAAQPVGTRIHAGCDSHLVH